MTLPLQKATYRALATSTPIKFGRSSKGNAQIAVEFDILGTNDETAEEVSTGETITWIGTFSDNTTMRTIESLLHCGWQGEDPADLNDKPASSELPTVVELVCEPDTWDGEVKLKVQWVNKPGRGRFVFKEAMSEGDLRAFGAQLRASVKSVRAAGGAPRAPRSQGAPARSGGYSNARHPNAPGGTDDDIPF
jgi:hypothetical protein